MKDLLFLDCNSCAPGTKRRSAAKIKRAGGRYVDVAVMTPVHPQLHKSPCLLAGALNANWNSCRPEVDGTQNLIRTSGVSRMFQVDVRRVLHRDRNSKTVLSIRGGSFPGAVKPHFGFDCGAVSAQPAFGIDGGSLCGVAVGLRGRVGGLDLDLHYSDAITSSGPGVFHLRLSHMI